MNILFVNATRSWGGIKTWMLELADFLSRRGHNVVVVCRAHDLLIPECKKRHLKSLPIHFGIDFSIRTIWRFVQIFKAEHTEVIITNIAKEIRTAGVAAKLKGLAHINRLGSFRDIKDTWKTRLYYNLLVDKVFVPSQSLFDHFAPFEFLRLKLRLFPNAVFLPPLAIPQNAQVKFAIVAKLSKLKQVDKVLQAFSHLQDLPWELHIGGFGAELPNLKKLTQELKLEQRVYFACQDEAAEFSKVDPYEFLKDKDVGVLYSSREAFGLAILEYMALSCAVIASNVGGIPEIITPNIDGMLVDPQNIAELEQAIRLMIHDPQRREELTRKGYEKVQQQFNQEIVFARVEEEIRQTIAHSQCT